MLNIKQNIKICPLTTVSVLGMENNNNEFNIDNFDDNELEYILKDKENKKNLDIIKIIHIENGLNYKDKNILYYPSMIYISCYKEYKDLGLNEEIFNNKDFLVYTLKKNNEYSAIINIGKNIRSLTGIFNSENQISEIKLISVKNHNINYISSAFKNFKNLETADLENFFLPDIDYSKMFSGCEKLKEIKIKKEFSQKKTDMSYMFSGCSSLKELDLSNFKTKKVTNMSHMFSGCSALINLKLDSNYFNTFYVTNMSYMFYGCKSLPCINISFFKTKNVEDMSYMFSECKSLQTINLYNINTQNVKNMSYMFSKCNSLKSLDLSTNSLSRVKSMQYMFFECISLEKIYFYSISDAENIEYMFYNCKNLTEINNVNILFNKNTINFQFMFYGCSSLKELKLSKLNTENVTNMSGMFLGCTALKELNLSNFNTQNVTDMGFMFYGCKSLKKLDLSGFNTKNVTDMSSMFSRCSSLINLNLSLDNFTTIKTTSIKAMFYGCEKINLKNYVFEINKDCDFNMNMYFGNFTEDNLKFYDPSECEIEYDPDEYMYGNDENNDENDENNNN